MFELLETYCLDCHDESEQKGEVNLEAYSIEWDEESAQDLWNRVFDMAESAEMPPQDEKQPSVSERDELVVWLDGMLSQHIPIGGSSLRRLNRREYEATLRDLFRTDFELPRGFPQDTESHGFDNQAEALTISGALLEAYSEVATEFAEKLFPPERKAVPSQIVEIPGKDFTYAYSSGSLVDGAMRLVSATPMLAHSASWPAHHEAPATGSYRLALELGAFNRWKDRPVVASVYAVGAENASSQRVDELRKLGRFEIAESAGQRFETEIVLEAGETLAIHYATGVIEEDNEALTSYLNDLFQREPGFAAAYTEVGGAVARGRLGLDHLLRLIDRGGLPEPVVGAEREELIGKIIKDRRTTTETLSYKLFQEGPALEIHNAALEGPLERLDSAEDRFWKERTAQWLGEPAERSEDAAVRAFLRKFLRAAFRRPVSKGVIEEYMELVKAESAARGRMEDGYHLAVRSALTSPRFLYREIEDGPLDSYDLASRLSYFLTSRPPDGPLRKSARDGSLLRPEILEEQARRLLESPRSEAFVTSFLGQWLDLTELDNLVPDATLFENPKEFKYTDAERDAFAREAQMVFREILDDNGPLEDFIDPDFTYTTPAVARFIYGLPGFAQSGKGENEEMVRVPLAPGGRFGGILGMAGVMTATANGVDTQPVLRGVWVLENVLGDPPPPPPDAVPALTPDTSKAETPREMLDAHMAEASCARCHRKIDPLGFVLESFDAIGRWRTEYVSAAASTEDQAEIVLPVETTGKLPDGTVLSDVTDLKAYLLDDISPFAECIAEKLLTYATGRAMNFSDRKLIRQIVAENAASVGGFQDLLLALVDSESFRVQ